MNDRFQAVEHISYTKDNSMHKTVSARTTNIFRVLKYKDGESDPYEVLEQHNALSATGKDRLLQIGVAQSTDHLTSATDLQIRNSSNTLVKTLTSCDSGFPKTSDDSGVSTKNLVFQWTDSSTDTYDANKLDVVSPGSAQFSTATAAFGTKPTTEQWAYEYTVTISSSDPDFNDLGLDYWLRMLVNFDINHWDAAHTRCVIYNGGTPISTKAPSSGPTVNTTSDTVTWVFTFASGEANGDWSTYTMKIESTGFVDYDADLRSGSTGTTGTKSTGDTWTLTYQFGIT